MPTCSVSSGGSSLCVCGYIVVILVSSRCVLQLENALSARIVIALMTHVCVRSQQNFDIVHVHEPFWWRQPLESWIVRTASDDRHSQLCSTSHSQQCFTSRSGASRHVPVKRLFNGEFCHTLPPAHVSICSLVNAWRHYVFTQSSSRPHLFNCASTIAVHTVGLELVGLSVDVTSTVPWTARSTGTDGAGIHVLVLAYGVRVWQLQYSATAVTSMYKENDTLKCYAMRFRFAAPVLLFNTKRCQRWKVKLLPIDLPPSNCAIH